jgi:hypothetical protein
MRYPHNRQTIDSTRRRKVDADKFNELCDFTEEAVKSWHRHYGLPMIDAQDTEGLDAHNKKYQEWMDFFGDLRAAGTECMDFDEEDEDDEE